MNISEINQRLLEVIDEVAAVSSRNAKKAILREIHPDVRMKLVKLLEYAHHPYKNYLHKRLDENLKFVDFDLLISYREHRDEVDLMLQILDRLNDEKLAGTPGKKLLSTYLTAYPEMKTLLLRTLRGDLRWGIRGKTIRELFPEFDIPSFGVQRCLNYGTELTGLRIIEPKWDGQFSLLIPQRTSEGTMWLHATSRSGRPQYNCELIVEEIMAKFPGWDQYVYNGEMFAGDWSTTDKIISRQRLHPDREQLKFKCWDMIPIAEWESKEFTRILHDRIGDVELMLQEFPIYHTNSMRDERVIIHFDRTPERIWQDFLRNFKPVQLPHRELERKIFTSQSEVMDAILKLYTDCGFEGMVIKDAYAPSSIGRNQNWIRYKPWETGDFRVIGVLEGRGRLQGSAGKLVLQLPDGKTVRCGSGLSDAQRKFFWEWRLNFEENPMIVEVKYKEASVKGKLREPIFIRIRTDKE